MSGQSASAPRMRVPLELRGTKVTEAVKTDYNRRSSILNRNWMKRFKATLKGEDEYGPILSYYH